MAILFGANPGQAIAISGDSSASTSLIAIEGIGQSWFPSLRAIMIQAQLALDGNNQFQHTCRDVIYFYPFGQRISQFRFSGMAFSGDCVGGGASIDAILAFYKANQTAVRTTPLQLQAGLSPAGRFRGFLSGMQLDMSRPDLQLSQFSFTFAVPGMI
jgi:hypothetical protein